MPKYIQFAFDFSIIALGMLAIGVGLVHISSTWLALIPIVVGLIFVPVGVLFVIKDSRD